MTRAEHPPRWRCQTAVDVEHRQAKLREIALDDFKRINQVPVFLADHPGAGHVGLFLEPNGEATKVELDWLAWRLDGDQAAARTFEGADCGCVVISDG
jgi:hypothetical protein